MSSSVSVFLLMTLVLLASTADSRDSAAFLACLVNCSMLANSSWAISSEPCLAEPDSDSLRESPPLELELLSLVRGNLTFTENCKGKEYLRKILRRKEKTSYTTFNIQRTIFIPNAESPDIYSDYL